VGGREVAPTGIQGAGAKETGSDRCAAAGERGSLSLYANTSHSTPDYSAAASNASSAISAESSFATVSTHSFADTASTFQLRRLTHSKSR